MRRELIGTRRRWWGGLDQKIRRKSLVGIGSWLGAKGGRSENKQEKSENKTERRSGVCGGRCGGIFHATKLTHPKEARVKPR